MNEEMGSSPFALEVGRSGGVLPEEELQRIARIIAWQVLHYDFRNDIRRVSKFVPVGYTEDKKELLEDLTSWALEKLLVFLKNKRKVIECKNSKDAERSLIHAVHAQCRQTYREWLQIKRLMERAKSTLKERVKIRDLVRYRGTKELEQRFSKREWKILCLLRGLQNGSPKTREQVAEHLNLSKKKVRSYELTATRKLREFLKDVQDPEVASEDVWEEMRRLVNGDDEETLSSHDILSEFMNRLAFRKVSKSNGSIVADVAWEMSGGSDEVEKIRKVYMECICDLPKQAHKLMVLRFKVLLDNPLNSSEKIIHRILAKRFGTVGNVRKLKCEAHKKVGSLLKKRLGPQVLLT